ncbi:MAG: hypothetical protein EOP62_15870 [Sphingomonadales bacterium]|nr:MAG: hypothetical protein EOP62_15870 [Sphingomonadales bacterium]
MPARQSSPGGLMLRLIVSACVLVLMPVAAAAQEDDTYGTYEDAETMRADQGIVRSFLQAGAAGLEAGNWTKARENCRKLNAHLGRSSYMGEAANKSAAAFGVACYADAQAMLGDIDSACRTYAEIDYKGLMASIDPTAVCAVSAYPAPPSREEVLRAEMSRLREQIERMFALNTKLKPMPEGDPERAGLLGELATLCGAFRTPIGIFEETTSALSSYCRGSYLRRSGRDAEACAPLREAAVRFDRIGQPWPRGVPNTDYLDIIRNVIPESLKLAKC